MVREREGRNEEKEDELLVVKLLPKYKTKNRTPSLAPVPPFHRDRKTENDIHYLHYTDVFPEDSSFGLPLKTLKREGGGQCPPDGVTPLT